MNSNFHVFFLNDCPFVNYDQYIKGIEKSDERIPLNYKLCYGSLENLIFLVIFEFLAIASLTIAT